MKLIEQWRAYVGPVDERVEAESNRIYKVGFIMLTFGLLVALGYDTMVRQIVWMHEIDMTGSGVMQFDMFHVMVVSWLLLTCLACAVLQSRKGFAEDGNRFSETDRFPGGYFALVSGLAAVVAGVLIALFASPRRTSGTWFGWRLRMVCRRSAGVVDCGVAVRPACGCLLRFVPRGEIPSPGNRGPAGRLRQLHVLRLQPDAPRCAAEGIGLRKPRAHTLLIEGSRLVAGPPLGNTAHAGGVLQRRESNGAGAPRGGVRGGLAPEQANSSRSVSRLDRRSCGGRCSGRCNVRGRRRNGRFHNPARKTVPGKFFHARRAWIDRCRS